MRSVSSPRAVNIRMGMSDAARTWRQTSKPSRSGSMTSRISASNPPCRNSLSPSAAVGRAVTVMPRAPRYSLTSAARRSSSSIIKTRSAIFPLALGIPTLFLSQREKEQHHRLRPGAVHAAPGLHATPLAMPPGGEVGERGALLGGEDLRGVGNGRHQPARGRVCEVQFRAADLPQGVTVDGRLRECLTQRLTVLVMLVPQRQQVLDGRLDNGVHLVALLLTGLDPVQDPVGGEGGPLPRDRGIDSAAVGPGPPTAAGVGMGIHAGTAREEARQQTAGHDTAQEPAARAGWWVQRLVS